MRLLIAVFLFALPAQAQETSLELVLLADASGSIDFREIRFQREGTAQAITDPAVVAAIQNTPHGNIAVTYIEWAANTATVVGWTLIDGPETARAFAEALAGPPRRAAGRNAIGLALIAGLDEMESNSFDGFRRVIDFSGDSIGNFSGPSIATAREIVLAAGVTINALPIVGERPGLAEAYSTRLIGGPGAFMVPAESRADFAEAMRRKLILEISGLPAPRTLADAGPAG